MQLSDSTDVKTDALGKGIVMFGKARRPAAARAGVRFCDSCAEVSTSAQRVERRYDHARTSAYTLIGPR